MSRFHSYLNTAKKILSSYEGSEPFASFLKKFFSAHKKYGSKDRKQISELSYSYFRLGKAAPSPPEGGILEGSLHFENKILTGLFLCSDKSNEILQHLKPEWNERNDLSINEKLSLAGIPLSSVFPWKEELSEGIDHEKFSASFFTQPDLFLRIRPGHSEKVLKKLELQKISYEFIPPFTLRFPNSFNAEKFFAIDREVVVQDYNSQRVGEFLPVRPGKVWDCCAASGGKSIMAYDMDPSFDLTVSDVRDSILINLRKRFERAGIKKYKSFVADLTNSFKFLPKTFETSFDLVIADVPCSGSGTWSRTPEQLAFFDEKKITEYAALQKKIVSNIIAHIKPGGHLLYITCSVFKKENEEMVKFINEKFHLQLKKMELLKGYEIKADSMFVALFEKSL